MSQAPTSASGLVRVTVASGTRRVDLVLPAAVPVAELVPELARSVGLLDPGTVYGGYRLVTREGRELAGDAGLAIQGIEDGGLITVTAGVDDEPPRVYDDVVEAMTDVVERDLEALGAGLRTTYGADRRRAADGARCGRPVHPGLHARQRRRGRGRPGPGHRRHRPLPRPARGGGRGGRGLDGGVLRRRRGLHARPRRSGVRPPGGVRRRRQR